MKKEKKLKNNIWGILEFEEFAEFGEFEEFGEIAEFEEFGEIAEFEEIEEMRKIPGPKS